MRQGRLAAAEWEIPVLAGGGNRRGNGNDSLPDSIYNGMSSAANACRQKFIGVSENGGVLHVEMIHKKRKEKKEKETRELNLILFMGQQKVYLYFIK